MLRNRYLSLFDMHHIISDGTSVSIIMEELTKLYKGESLEELRVQYKDYSAWENKMLASEGMKKHEEYWTNIFSDEIPVLNLPTDYPRPSIQSFEGESIGFTLDKALTEKLNKISKANGATLYMTLLAAYNILLSKYSGQEDIVVGSAAAGRLHVDLQNMVGMFVNTLALRNYPEGKKTFKEFLQEVKKNALNSYENQDYQFDTLVEKLGIKRDLSRNALFDTMFVLQNTDIKEIELSNIRITKYEYRGKVSSFDITLEAEEKGEEIKFNLEYCTKLFKKETIERIIEHFKNIIKEVAENPRIQLCEIDTFSEEEKRKILVDFNNTKIQYPKDTTIYKLFEEQVERTPDNIAVVYKNQKLTYRELNEKANSLARRLKEKEVKADSIVGIMSEGSVEMLIGILGILKSGAAYLPIDPKYPKDRIDYMLEDSRIRILLTDFQPKDRIGENTELILLKDEALYKGENTNLEIINTSKDIAYIIYTSGSSGKPKGVMIEHSSLINLSKWHIDYYEITERDNSTKYAGFGFDASVWEIFPYIITGAAIHVIDEEIKLDLEKLNEYYNENTITISFLPTQICEQFMKIENKTLRYLLTGGDKLRYFEAKSYKIVNNYGPTENTVVTTSFEVDKGYDNIPIGKPIANTQIYILDNNNKLLPIGIPGELCIGGESLARGYLNNTELTAEKFIENSFAKGQRLYKTGDLARWLPDGNIEFLGRIDYQIKIRGFRIELGEIESSLLKLTGVKEAAVIDREKEGNKYLCAYLVSEVEYSARNLREELKKSLPDYMIPSYFITLLEMPLNQNGKIDRKALPIPDGNIETGAEYIAATNDIEEELISIWSEVLGVGRIGINDNFFELGGHSLKAIKIVSIIQKELMVEVSVGDIFINPTVRQLGEYIGKTKEIVYSSIEAVEERELYEVSSAQKRMFALNQFSKEETNYNVPYVLILEGKLDKSKVEESLNKLVQRHEAFRTSFELVNEEIMQRIHKAVEFNLEYEEINTDSEEIIKSEAEKFIKPFDLSKAPLLRVKLIMTEEEKYVLMFDMHHIISDGISMSIIMEEFTKLYKGESLETLRIQYKDYSAWENIMLASEGMKKHEEYWINILSDEIPVLNLPTDYLRPSTQSFEGENISFKLGEDLTNKLKEITKANGATLYMTLLSTYNILLSKYSGQEDIIVGSPIAGRPHADLYNMVGMFVNTLVMRNYTEGKKTFNEFLQEVKKNALNAYENQDYQFDKLVEKLDIRRDLSRNALFDTMFTLQNTENKEIELDNVRIKQLQFEIGISKFDINLSAEENGEEIEFNFKYCTKLFKRETIERLVEHFKNILKEVAENPTQKLSELNILSEEEKHKLIYDFNNTKAEYQKDKTLYQLFEQQASKTPDNIAAIFEEEYITYRELDAKSNQLARILREKGVKADSIVAMSLYRSIEMTIGIMAIQKAGGAYLPISPEYPEDRIRYMLEDSNASVLLTQSHLQDKYQFENTTVIAIDDKELYKGDNSSLQPISGPNNLAYVIYTSGSTGKPKGAMIEHHSAINRIKWMQKRFPIGEKDVILQKTPYTFDVSVWELFWWSMEGAKVCFLTPGGEKDPEEIVKAIEKQKITTMHFVPSMLNIFLEYIEGRENLDRLSSLKQVFSSGEALTAPQVERFNRIINSKIGTKLINLYGPTEATVDVSYFDCSTGEQFDVIPIGKPIDNISLLVVDKHNNLLPVGVPGELCISGVGVGRGYLNRPELTAEKFVQNPHIPGERMYKTGDLTKWMPDGNIEYLGRIDNQVKIRGFRIELGEIENELLKHNEIKEAIVIDKADKNGNKYLCGYIVAERELTVSELKEHLLKNLPDYMIPAYFITMDKLPLSANGKADRKALLELETEGSINTGVEYVAPTNKIEEKLVSIWSEVLGVGRIGINDNFFDLGGHSLKAIKIVSIIQKELMAEISVGYLFSNPTVNQLGKYIEKTKEIVYSSIEAVEERELYEVSSAQKRMFALNQFSKKEINYNIPSVMILEGKLEKDKVEESFNKLVERHEAFRTSFELVDNEIMQRIHKAVQFKVEYEEINKFDAEGFVKPFDLSKAPLLRVKLIRLEEEKYVLMFDMHHIISDGISMSIIMEEFTKLYKGKSLETLRIQYKDYSAWENKMLTSEGMKKHEEYWTNIFSDEIPILDLPTDYPRPSTQSFEGESIEFTLDKSLTEKLNKIGKANGATLYMTLLTAYNILLSKYSGQEDIVVGSPIAGRPHADLYNMVGMFINTLVMRNYPGSKKTFNEFLQEVKKNALNAYENQDYQFDKLVEKLDIRRDLSRNALFDTMFILQNTEDKEIELDDVKIKQLQFEVGVSKFDITLSAKEKGEEIKFNFEYCTKLFKRKTIERVIEHFKNILKEVAENPALKLCEIDMLLEEEKKEILIDFNDTKTEYPKDKTIHELFEEQVIKTPDKIALVFGDKSLTYKELNEKSNRLGRALREKGVKQESIVGIMVERSLEMIIGIMGILKAGGAYLPIDPEYPVDRIKYILEDSKAKLLLTQSKYINKLKFAGEILNLDSEQCYKNEGDNLKNVNSPENLAYIIYTSGSTGNPKGVMIEHGSTVNTLTEMERNYPLGEKDVYLLKTSYTFDVSVTEIFGWFVGKGKLAILKAGEEKDIYGILNAIGKYEVTHINFVPSMLNLFLEVLEEKNIDKTNSLKYVFAAGEALIKETVNRFHSLVKTARLENIYGPTETTIYVTKYSLNNYNNDTKNIPIGKPLSNIKAYIINENGNLQPVGVQGELCFSGVGLARGYLNKPELTAEKFIENPFDHGERIYKTGDLARWQPDGNIEFLGRIDHQVKIRGFRIELGEIESQLLKYEGISEVIVIAKEDNSGNKYLCGYICGEREYSISELREHLAKELPEYMIPSYFIQLDKLPLTANGKIDRKALPVPDGSIETGAEYIAATNEIEEKLISIWHEVLGVEKIGINDNFFELGGHSLKAIKIVSIIQKELMVEISVGDIFSNPTVRQLGDCIEKTKESAYSSIEAVVERKLYEVSSAQKRMYALNQFSMEETNYNIPSIMILEGKLEKSKLEESFKKLVERHEAFRTSFDLVNEEIMQRIHKAVEFNVEYEEINADSEGIIKSEAEKFIKPFDLSKAPLLRVKLIRLEEEKYILMFDMHHIISDGESMSIIMEEFTKLYKGESLEELRIQYKDYSAWENKMLTSEGMKKHEEYWINRFGDEIPVLDLPTDYPRPNIQSFEGESIGFTLDKNLTEKLNKIGKAKVATLYMTLLTAYNIMLSKYSGQVDIVVGSPIAGRVHADLYNMVGMFVNTLVMRNYPEGKKTFNEFLQEVKKNALNAYENQDYQFDKLVEKLDIRRDLSRNALFDTMFTLQNTENKEMELDNVRIKQLQFDVGVSKFDIALSAEEKGEEIELNLRYCTKLFKRDTIERAIKHFINILKEITENPEIKLCEIDMLSEEEKKKILIAFNDTKAEYPKDKTICEYFEEQVRNTPDNAAVAYE
ncbi:MAG: amino acid adenylation domain-containing protein, partial [Lutisporaceae bacterium]